jgi:hypothetical protein
MHRIRTPEATNPLSILVSQMGPNPQHPVRAQDPEVGGSFGIKGISDVISEAEYVGAQRRQIAARMEIDVVSFIAAAWFKPVPG